MKSLMTFIGVLAFNFSSFSLASEFSCPVNANIAAFTCSGTVKVKTLAELNSYKNDLGVVAKKPTVAKNLQIDFNPALTSDLVISSPCSIKIPANITMTSTANICLHGKNGVSIDDNFNFNGKNLKLESSEEVALEKNFVMKAQDIKLLSIGSGETSKAYIRENANIEAANFTIESNNKGFVGKNSVVKLTGMLGIYSLGDDEASVREGANVQAAKIEVSSSEETRVAKNVQLTASEVILNGVKCTINKTAVIKAEDRLGNCFLTSLTKAKFSVDKVQGALPLTVTFNASAIADAKGYVWAFGDGETLNSTSATVTHTYTRLGSFTATLKYATKDNFKGLKSAGAIQIDVKNAQEPATIPPSGYFNYYQDGTFVYLKSFIRRKQFDIASAYYVIDGNENNKIYLSSFYPNTTTGVELSTYGKHTATLHVEDVRGQKYSKSMNMWIEESENDIYPFVRLDAEQSAPRTVFVNMGESFIPVVNEQAREFTIDFGDGHSTYLDWDVTTTHTYAQAGTYTIVATAEYNGNVEVDTYDITVTDEDLGILNPVAAFEYKVLPQAGNVVFHYEKSGTPNGELISYMWDFGDGTTTHGGNVANFYAPGDYLVTLTVVDTAGMRASQTQKITIVEPGENIASILNCYSSGEKALNCQTIALDKFNQIARVKLDWGDGTFVDLTQADYPARGQSNREHTYANYGTYNVKLTVDTTRGETVYVDYEKEFVDPNIPVDPEEPSEPTIKFQPVAILKCNLENLTVSCDGLQSTDPQQSILNYHFDFGDGTLEDSSSGSVVHTYTEYGGYNVKLTVKNIYEKTSDAYTWVQINQIHTVPPTAILECSRERFLVTCNAQTSTDPQNSKLKYYFNFGDGTTGSSADGVIQHLYSNLGGYSLKLTVENEFGQTSDAYTWIQINYETSEFPPVADIQCTTNNLLIMCNALGSYDPRGSALEYNFTFGDDTNVKNMNGVATHAYASSGIYSVAVTVKNSYGDEAYMSTLVQTVDALANKPPHAEIECETIRPFTLKCYPINDSDVDGNIISFNYVFDDGFSSTLGDHSSLEHTFSDVGMKQVVLIVTDNDGATMRSMKSFLVKENSSPVIDWINCTSEIPEHLSCMASAFDPDSNDNIIDYSWDIGDGVVLSTFLPSFSNFRYTTPGEKQVKLVVHDQYGKIDTKTVEVYVKENMIPSAVFNCTASQNGLVDCISYSSDTDGFVKKITWYLDDGAVLEGAYISHFFQSGDVHSVKMVVEDNLGAKSELVKDVQVNLNKLPTFEILPGALFGYIPFESELRAANVLDEDGYIVSYEWSYNGAVIGIGPILNYKFDTAGIFRITLKIKDNSGGVSEKFIDLSASNKSSPVITYNAVNGNVLPVSVILSGEESTDEYGEIVAYDWYVAGKKIGSGKEISHLVDNINENIIELRVVNKYGVITSIDKEIPLNIPDLYIDMRNQFDLFSGNDFKEAINYEYKGDRKDNLVFDLENAPDGMYIDESDLTINWDPALNENKNYAFNIIASDGVIEFKKTINIKLYARNLIKSINLSSEQNEYTINLTDSILDGAQFSFSGIGGSQLMRIYESKTEQGSIVDFISDEPEKIRITLKNNAFIEESSSDFFYRASDKKNPGQVVTLSSSEKCTNSPIRFIANGLYDSVLKINFPTKVEGVDANVFFQPFLSKDNTRLIIQALREVNSILKAEGRKNIYVGKYYLTKDNVSGLTPKNSLDSFIISLPSKWSEVLNDEKKIVMIKHTLLHEFFHTRQNNISDCKLGLAQILGDQSVKQIIESSAEYYGLIKLNYDDRKTFLLNMYIGGYSQDLFEYYEDIVKPGMFNQDEEYNSRIVWDIILRNPTNGTYINIDEIFTFIKNYPSMLLPRSGVKVLKEFANFKNIDLGSVLFNFNNISTFPNADYSSYPIFSILKDPNLYGEWKKDDFYSKKLENGDLVSGKSDSFILNPLGSRRLLFNNSSDIGGLGFGQSISSPILIKLRSSSDNIKFRIGLVGKDGEVSFVNNDSFYKKVPGGYDFGIYSANYAAVLDIVNVGQDTAEVSYVIKSNVKKYYFDLRYDEHTLGSPDAIVIECVSKCSDIARFDAKDIIRSNTHISGKKILIRAGVGEKILEVSPLVLSQDVNDLDGLYIASRQSSLIEVEEDGWFY